MTGVKLLKRRYGKWGGRKGCMYKPNRCCVEVYSDDGLLSWQCTRRNGHGTDRLFCHQHKDTKDGD